MKEITTQQLQDLLAQHPDLSLIDVRPTELYRQSHIAESVNIPLDTLADQIATLDPSRPHYIICRSGNTSQLACQRFEEAGLDATNVTGGMFAYEGAVEPSD